MRTEKVTIAQIAESLKISSISVSRALSGQAGVSEELRNKIICEAQKMGYKRSKNNENINILVLHKRPYVQDNSTFSYKVQGIEKAIQDIGAEYSVEFIDTDSSETLTLPTKVAKGHIFDGVIFIGKFDHKYIQFLKEKIKNQVIYAGHPSCYDYDNVWFNFNNSGYKQCEYLIKSGHKDIGFIGQTSIFKNKEKLMGITTALEDYSLPVESDFFIDINEDFNERVEELLSNKKIPTAIICQWDHMAIKLIKLLYEKNIKIPEDLSIIGSGNTEMSNYSIPSLTTMDLNIEYSCEVAVALLMKRINNPSKPYENISINSNLIERDSVKNLD